MLTIYQNDARNIPIIMEKSDYSPLCIISSIIHGEFNRNKEITIENFNLALASIRDLDLHIDVKMTEEALNSVINNSLRILYGKN